jgi:hypothetical protein
MKYSIASGAILLCLFSADLANAQIVRRVLPPGSVPYYGESRRYVAPTPPPSTPASTVRSGPEVLTRPTLIKSSGSYVLGGNIYAASDATTAAIVIAAGDVTLDLAGFTVIGRGATSADASGIAIMADRATVRNGSVNNFNAENQCSIIVGGGVHNFGLYDLKMANSDTGILLNPDNQENNPVVGGRIERCMIDGGSVGVLGFASQGVTLRDCNVIAAAARRQVPGEGSGVLLRGSAYLVEGCNMTACTHGLRLDADFSLVRGCSLSTNRNTGAYIGGRGNQVQDCEISGNGIAGVSLLGENCSFINDHFTGNGGHGLSLDKTADGGANHTYIKDCAASGNSGAPVSDKGLGDTRIEGGMPGT